MVKRTFPLDQDSGGTWHPGEIDLQRSIGKAEKMAKFGKRVVRDHMPEQHRDFFAQLPFVMIGTVDDEGNPWAGVRVGEPGFITSPDPQLLQIAGHGVADDPMEAGLDTNAPIGLLGIEFHTRRRNRMNGLADRLADNLIQVAVDQSFGNCPQYIQSRRVATADDTRGPVETLTELDAEAHAQIKTADTFFVASYADRPDRRQVDVSHRGGRAGFVAVESDGALIIPDFKGNNFFATLGNILLNGRAGLLFVDFTEGTLLQMSGRAEVLPVDPEIKMFQGAERFWRFRPERIVRRRGAIPIRFAFEDWSPNLRKPGDIFETREGP